MCPGPSHQPLALPNISRRTSICGAVTCVKCAAQGVLPALECGPTPPSSTQHEPRLFSPLTPTHSVMTYPVKTVAATNTPPPLPPTCQRGGRRVTSKSSPPTTRASSFPPANSSQQGGSGCNVCPVAQLIDSPLFATPNLSPSPDAAPSSTRPPSGTLRSRRAWSSTPSSPYHRPPSRGSHCPVEHSHVHRLAARQQPSLLHGEVGVFAVPPTHVHHNLAALVGVNVNMAIPIFVVEASIDHLPLCQRAIQGGIASAAVTSPARPLDLPTGRWPRLIWKTCPSVYLAAIHRALPNQRYAYPAEEYLSNSLGPSKSSRRRAESRG